LYTLEEQQRKNKNRRSPESRYRLHRGPKDVDYDIEFIGGIKNSISVERVCSTPPFEALELFTYNLYLSADSLTELLLQHQKQEEIAAVKEAYWRIRKFGWR
jgi:hypothetical protein